MADHILVTFGSDGFRDWVSLPDGRTFNMGSVSVLNFVVGLARNSHEARLALDTFLANQQATLAVKLAELQLLLAPKKARWAGLEETSIPSDSRMAPHRGMHMDPVTMTLLQSRLASVEDVLHRLEVGSLSASDVSDGLLGSVRAMLAMVSPVQSEPEGLQKVAASYDEDMLRELEVYLDNEMSLQAQRRTILKRLIRGGRYDLKEAATAFEDWVEAGAKSYAKEFDEDPKKFPRELVKDLAMKMAKLHDKAVTNGEWDHLKSAAEDTPGGQGALVNEGLAYAVLAKIEQAHSAVLDSKSRFASLANEDLSRISTNLVSVLDVSDLGGSTTHMALLDLSKKTDHVLSHFSR